jgi:hypothetical protein
MPRLTSLRKSKPRSSARCPRSQIRSAIACSSPVPQCFWKTATASAAQAMWALSIMPITLNQNCNARPTSAGAVLCTVTKFSSHLDLGQLAGRQLRCPLCSPLLLESLNDEQEAGSKSLETLKSLQNERLQRRAALGEANRLFVQTIQAVAV